MRDFFEGFAAGLRPFREALPLLLKGAGVLLAGLLCGVIAVLLGADALGGAIIVLTAIASTIIFVLAWIHVIRAVMRREAAS